MPHTRSSFIFLRLAAVASLLWLSGCGRGGEPFNYVQIHGRVTYEDGSRIPAEVIRVVFVPQCAARDAKTHPMSGIAFVNVADGTFSSATTHRYNDGVIRGKHKVLVNTTNKSETPTGEVPSEYTRVETTPLVVDTAQQPFVLKVRKPH